MEFLNKAIAEAKAEQYPAGQKDTRFFMEFSGEARRSARARWSEHFRLQLKSAGFVITDSETPPISQIVAENLVVSEMRFHPERKWRFDFAIPSTKIAIEIEGGIWMRGGGAHSRPANIQRDVEKQNAAVLLGWHPLRFSPTEIKSGESIKLVCDLHKILLAQRPA